jgi:hypothetical protein
MKMALAVVLLVLTCTVAHALEIDPFKGPKPVAVLIQTDPWLDVIGSDTPMVAIYDDGQIVYKKREKGKASTLLHKQLSREALAEIKRKLSSFGDYSTLKRHYDLMPNVTDQPEAEFYLSLGGKEFVTEVYGLAVPDAKLPAYTVFDRAEKPDKLPQAIKDLHTYLIGLDFADAKPWMPTYVEVMIWPYEYAPNESIHWPKDWPGLESPNTLHRGEAYSIFLPGQELPRLRAFLKTRREKGAIDIQGKKWAACFRFTFPSEPVWWQALGKEPEEENASKPNAGKSK